MALTIHIKTVQSAADAAAEPQQARRSYTRKADREASPYGPPELGLRPSRYRLAERLYEHYARVRNDRTYQRAYEGFERAEQIRAADAREERSSRVGGPRVRASELKGCARMTAMRLMGFDAEPVGVQSPWWQIAAISGTGLHERLETALKFLGIPRRSEFVVETDDGTLGGRVDHELGVPAFYSELGNDALGAILDVKTVKSRDFELGCWGDKVPGYVAQVSVYGHITRTPIGVVLLVDRNEGRLFDFEWSINQEYAAYLLRRAAGIVADVRARRLPEPEARRDGQTFVCDNFCPFRRQCCKDILDGSIQEALDAGADPGGL